MARASLTDRATCRLYRKAQQPNAPFAVIAGPHRCGPMMGARAKAQRYFNKSFSRFVSISRAIGNRPGLLRPTLPECIHSSERRCGTRTETLIMMTVGNGGPEGRRPYRFYAVSALFFRYRFAPVQDGCPLQAISSQRSRVACGEYDICTSRN